MAKITKIEHSVLGETIAFPVKVSASGIFSTEWPARLYGAVEHKNEFNTLAELSTEISRVVSEIEALAVTHKDVIRYKVDQLKQRRANWFANNFHFRGLSIEFIALRVETCGKRTTEYCINRAQYGRGQNESLPDGFRIESRFSERTEHMNEIPFTVANYEFFEQMQGKLSEMAEKLNLFLTPEQVELLAISNQLPAQFK